MGRINDDDDDSDDDDDDDDVVNDEERLVCPPYSVRRGEKATLTYFRVMPPKSSGGWEVSL